MVRRIGRSHKIINNYKGWEGTKTKKIDKIDADIDPKIFWRDYISQRKPVSLLFLQILNKILVIIQQHRTVQSQYIFSTLLTAYPLFA